MLTGLKVSTDLQDCKRLVIHGYSLQALQSFVKPVFFPDCCHLISVGSETFIKQKLFSLTIKL